VVSIRIQQQQPAVENAKQADFKTRLRNKTAKIAPRASTTTRNIKLPNHLVRLVHQVRFKTLMEGSAAKIAQRGSVVAIQKIKTREKTDASSALQDRTWMCRVRKTVRHAQWAVL
jgi:hypothetical protein